MQNQALSALTVLVTRPKQLAQPLCEAIEALGGNACLYPTINIVAPADPRSLDKALKHLDAMDLCIFISQHAVLASAPLLKQHWPSLPSHLQIAAIGSATAAQLRQHQLPVHLCPTEQFSSEGLLNLKALQILHNKKVLIIRGEGGREKLAQTIQQRGGQVFETIAYRRQRPCSVKLPVALNKIDIIVSTSNESLDNLWAMLAKDKQQLAATPLLVLSHRMASHAKQLGFLQVPIVAKQASNQAIVDCLIQYSKGNEPHGEKSQTANGTEKNKH